MKVAIAYLTKDRVELTKQTASAVCNAQCAVFWIDGSETLEGQQALEEADYTRHHSGVRGGADAAIVFALTAMLNHPVGYTHVGLCENDVLLAPDWFERTMALFDIGAEDGLCVGAVSARAYADRILIQRDGWAVMHNLGAGHVVFTRQAAELILANYRTGWWPDNRALFAQLAGVDIGRYACFRGNAQWTTADWHFDAILAQHGLASLALTPCAAGMIGQEPSLEEQGLTLITEEVERFRNDEAFELYARGTAAIREGTWRPQVITPVHRSSMNGGTSLIFPHQMTEYDREGDWRLKWTQGFGPFSWRSNDAGAPDNPCRLQVKIFGACVILVSGGEREAKVTVIDTHSGYEIAPEVPPASHGITQLAVPGACAYRDIVIYIANGGIFYGIQCQEPQPLPSDKFDYSDLPPV
jgi:hypothetical protein